MTKTLINTPIATLRAEHALLQDVAPPPEIQPIPHPIDGQLDRRLTLVLDPDSERSAAFRVLRHHLIAANKPQVVIVSSALAGEGTTTVALNLALALAECGRARVLLAEANVHRPQLSDIVGIPPPWCFGAQVLEHRAQPHLPWTVLDLRGTGLHVAAVSPGIEQTQLLDGVAFGIAMDQLRLAGYEHIIVDAPPVLGSAEVNLMLDAADAVLLTVRARRSTGRDLQRAIDQLATRKLVGTVLVDAGD